jgi:hypothetical protein
MGGRCGSRRAFQRGDRFASRHPRLECKIGSEHRIASGGRRGEDRGAARLFAATCASGSTLAAHLFVIIIAVVGLGVLLVVVFFGVFIVVGFRLRLGLARLLVVVLLVVVAVFCLRVFLVFVFVVAIAFSACGFLVFVILSLGGFGGQAGEMGERQPARRKGTNAHEYL